MKVSGLDALSRKLKEIERATAGLDGEIAQLEFNPHDPQSIEDAIQQLNSTIDGKLAGYGRNDIVVRIAAELKERGRRFIIDRAAKARLEGEDTE